MSQQDDYNALQPPIFDKETNTSWLEEPDEAALSSDERQILVESIKVNGYLHNFTRILAATPTLSRNFVLHVEMLITQQEQLTRRECEIIATTVSSINQCEICLVSHREALREILHKNNEDVNQADLLAINYRRTQFGIKEQALISYAVKLTERPYEMTESDIQTLRTVGYSDQAIFQIIHVVCLFNYTNRLASGTGIRVNPETFRRAYE
jgi:uncharacterized peroxidase-related enzyme